MLISEQFKIAIKMMLAEANVSVVDEYGQTTLAANLNGTQYILDASVTDPLQAWLDIERGQLAPNTIQQQLYNMVSKDPEHGQLLQQLLQQIKSNGENRRRRPPTTGTGGRRRPSLEDAPEWVQEYAARFSEMENELFPVPDDIRTVFKNASYNYMMYDDPAQDFVAIMPTPISLAGGQRDRAVYVLRKEADKTIPQLGIRGGMSYTEYIPSIEAAVGNNLLQVREALVQAGLGRAFRRDNRIKTVTEWIPSGLFQTYDEFMSTADTMIEQVLNKIADTITEDV